VEYGPVCVVPSSLNFDLTPVLLLFVVKFYCVQHSGLQKLSRPGGNAAGRDISDYSKSCLTPPSHIGPGKIHYCNAINTMGFIQTLESPEIKMLRFPGLESPGKRCRSQKTLKSPGILK